MTTTIIGLVFANIAGLICGYAIGRMWKL